MNQKNDTHCAWTALLPSRRSSPTLSGHINCAVAVIGAGLVGMAAARRLAELMPGEPTVVLDAGAVAEGSAGRNSGYMIDVPLSHAMGAKSTLGTVASAQLTLSRRTYAWLEGIVRAAHIDCGWHRGGRFYAAATDDGIRALDGVVEQFEGLNEPATRVHRDELREQLGTNYYRAAVFNPSCTLVQPAALIRGLADSMPESVQLHEHSRVTDWSPSRGMHELRTAGGTVKARRVIWATHTDLRDFSRLGGRYMTLYTYAGVTPELSDEELGHGALQQWGVLPALRAGSTVRRIPGGRMLVRSLWSYGRTLTAPEIRQGLQPLLAARFPAAAAKGFEYVWGGPVSITRHADAYFGEFRPGAYAFTGCNGSGIVKGSAYGRLLAELACDHRSEELDLALNEPMAGWIPPEPLRRVAVHFTLWRNARHTGVEV
ncbi:MAG: NAD(P)/FAD-dependent oxidoreductase [Burkholderiaceae bacterium]